MRVSRRSLIASAVLSALVVVGLPAADAAPSPYLVGRGISDVTGPAAENGMMGYSAFDQKTTGIHQRQRSRAYVVVDQGTGKRVAYVNADLAMIFRAVQEAVLAKLQARYGSLYTRENVLLSATHTHAGPGGSPTTSPTTSRSSACSRRRWPRSWTASPSRSSRPTRT